MNESKKALNERNNVIISLKKTNDFDSLDYDLTHNYHYAFNLY